MLLQHRIVAAKDWDMRGVYWDTAVCNAVDWVACNVQCIQNILCNILMATARYL